MASKALVALIGLLLFATFALQVCISHTEFLLPFANNQNCLGSVRYP
jgi:hypothetical protein